MKRFGRWLVGALSAAVLLVAAACGAGSGNTGSGPDPEPSGDAGTPAGEPVRGGRIVVGVPDDPSALDPYVGPNAVDAWVYGNIYETLLKLNEDMELEPSLATHWEQLDERTWRFYLRQGVRFHDGTTFDAEAVKFNFDRVFNPDAPGRGAGYVPAIERVEVVDPYTVDITTREPSGPFLRAMSLIVSVGMASPTQVQQYGDDYGVNPAGTGPFRFVSWRPDQEIVLARFDDYWGEPAYLDEVVFRVIPDETSRQLAFENGDLDVLMRPDPSQMERLRTMDGVQVLQVPGLRVYQLGLRTRDGVFSDVRVRQAANHAVNKEAISQFITEGLTEPPQGYITPATFGFSPSGIYEYDPERAAQLLEQAGWQLAADGIRYRDGQPLRVTMWSYQGRDLKDREISEAVQQQLAEVGFDVQLRLWDLAQYWSAVFSEELAEADIYTLGWTSVTGDADFNLYPQLHSSQFPDAGGWNFSYFHDDRVDELLDRGRYSTDQEERLEAYRQALEIIGQQAPWIPIYQTTEVRVLQDRVKGFRVHPVEHYLWFHRVWVDEQG